MQKHADRGRRILQGSSSEVVQLAAEIAASHHERWDGTGYPNGLAGEAIPESARIVAVADVFDALASVRPYKEAWPLEQVVARITDSSGSHFDPDMVAAFLDCLPRILEVKAYWEDREREGLAPAQEPGAAGPPS